MILNKMVKEVVGYVLDGIFSSDNVRISDEKSDQIYSLASCISAGEKIKIEGKKGLCSIFDRLNLKQGEKPCENILRYDKKNGVFTRYDQNNEKSEESDVFDLDKLKKQFESISDVKQKFIFLKQYTSDIPCTESGELSLYSYIRLVTAFASAMMLYYKEKGCEQTNDMSKENSFVLYTADFSGIQNFIYTIINEDALKTLRAKSFFVELVMAQLTSEIVECFGLTEANVLYSGGGHCYILLPALSEYKSKLEQMHKALNEWSIKNFNNGLSVVWETQECSPNDFMNKPYGAYAKLFSGLSGKMARKKLQKYSSYEIIFMNRTGEVKDGKRECKICGASSAKVKSDDGDVCEWCDTFRKMSNIIMDRQKCFVVLKKPSEESVPFFSFSDDAYFSFGDSQEISRQIKDDNVIRIFCKNEYPSDHIREYRDSYIIDVCDYSADNMLENLSESSNGIKRLGVLRMDVDNLGSTFISGFNVTDKNGETVDDSYVNIGRTAALSSQLTGFFKNNLSLILKNGSYNVSVLYAGGDDVFLVGSWDHVINASLKIIKEFKDITGDKLSASAGIGIYNHKYPVARFAVETELLEDCSKKNPSHDKDSVTLFSNDGNQTYSWHEFAEKVMGEKYVVLEQFIKGDSLKGNSFLYKLLEYLRGINKKDGDRINVARAAYLLGRMCSEIGSNKEQRKHFSDKVFGWITSDSESDRKQLITAINVFVYRERSAK